MHGLIFVTWENYLGERFGPEMLYRYREQVRTTAADAPLVSKMYDDATLLAGVGAASTLTRTPVDTLLTSTGSTSSRMG